MHIQLTEQSNKSVAKYLNDSDFALYVDDNIYFHLLVMLNANKYFYKLIIIGLCGHIIFRLSELRTTQKEGLIKKL